MSKPFPVISLITFLPIAVCGCGSTSSRAPEAAGTSGQAQTAGASQHAGSGGQGDGGSSAGESGASGDASAAGEAGAGGEPPASPRPCDDGLKALDLGPHTAVTLVKAFAAGSALSLESPLPGPAPLAPYALCLVKLVVGPGNPGPSDAPSTSTGIGIEIWLPAAANWNERYQALGNGGFAGGPEVKSLTAIGSLRLGANPVFVKGEGFVTSINDGGHDGVEGSFAMNPDGSSNQALLDDFAERATHEMALQTKALIREFYGRPPRYSYFNGCSEGGREGLREAQRFPDDFDGVLAGAPAIYLERFALAELWPQVVMKVDLGGPMAAAKLAAVTAAANASCGDALTGQADGYISDPAACRYDPTTDPALLCVSAGGTNSSATCLSVVEATAVNKIWYGPTSNGTVPSPATDNGRGPLDSTHSWYGFERGTRLAGHPLWGGVAGARPFPVATDMVALTLGDPTFAQPTFTNATGNGQDRWQTIDYAGPLSFRLVANLMKQRFTDLLSTADPNLAAFAERGGRLLMWHGTGDSLIPPSGSKAYYEALAAHAGGYTNAAQFARLYLGPGYDHCLLPSVDGTHPPAPGGRGDPQSGLMEVLQSWREKAQPLGAIAAVSEPGASPVRARPWCPYPTKLKSFGGEANTGDFACE